MGILDSGGSKNYDNQPGQVFRTRISFSEEEDGGAIPQWSDNSTDILYQYASDVKWVSYNKLHVGNYEKVHYDTMSDVVVLKVGSKENTCTRAIQD